MGKIRFYLKEEKWRVVRQYKFEILSDGHLVFVANELSSLAVKHRGNLTAAAITEGKIIHLIPSRKRLELTLGR